MPTYRLRIELPDRPGALAGVTGVIAAQGGRQRHLTSLVSARASGS